MPKEKENGLPASERIKHTKLLKEVFATKQTVFSYPYKLGYLLAEKHLGFPQIVVAVPKRTFKHAVDRNRIKRQTKEIYRNNKRLLQVKTDQTNASVKALYIRYVGKEAPDFAFAQRKLTKCLKEIAERIGN